LTPVSFVALIGASSRGGFLDLHFSHHEAQAMKATLVTSSDPSAEPAEIAGRFVAARLAKRFLPAYPGLAPATMAESYAIQDIAIDLFPDRLVGWKVGGVAPSLQSTLGVHRLAGAVFAANVWPYDGRRLAALPAIDGGFAAVEAEFIARIGADADPAKTDWTLGEALDVVDKVFVGVELAGSPLASINDLGPTVVASDFGNNGGVVVGPEVENWRERMEDMEVETVINGASVGIGGSRSLEGGAMESVRFLLEHCARRGRPLNAGMLITTGAVTGVHRVQAGDETVCVFRGVAEIHCSVVRAGGN